MLNTFVFPPSLRKAEARGRNEGNVPLLPVMGRAWLAEVLCPSSPAPASLAELLRAGALLSRPSASP